MLASTVIKPCWLYGLLHSQRHRKTNTIINCVLIVSKENTLYAHLMDVIYSPSGKFILGNIKQKCVKKSVPIRRTFNLLGEHRFHLAIWFAQPLIFCVLAWVVERVRRIRYFHTNAPSLFLIVAKRHVHKIISAVMWLADIANLIFFALPRYPFWRR